MGGSNPKNVLGAICFAASDSVANRQRACERELHPAAAELAVDNRQSGPADAQLQGITGIERANGRFCPVVFGLNC